MKTKLSPQATKAFLAFYGAMVKAEVAHRAELAKVPNVGESSMDKRITCDASTVVTHEGNPDEGLRVYNSAPGTISVQVRTNGPTAASGKGVSRPAYSTARLNRADTLELIESLQHALTVMID